MSNETKQESGLASSSALNPSNSIIHNVNISAHETTDKVMKRQQSETRDLNTAFNRSTDLSPKDDHPILNNVCIININNLVSGNVLPLIVGDNWNDADICGYCQVVQMDFNRGKATMQLANKDDSLPPLGFLTLEKNFNVYALTHFGLLSIGKFRDNEEAAKINIVSAIAEGRAGYPSQQTMELKDTTTSTALALLSKSASTISAKEEAKTLALRKILFNNEADIKYFLMNTGQIDSWHCQSAAALRLPEYLRKMPSFSGENLKAFVLLKFSHVPVKDCWYIGSLAQSSTGHFSSINGLLYALPNLEQAFANVFRHNSTGKPTSFL
jgi:hypothetical protein